MALITMPSGKIQTVEWHLTQPAQATVSEWTGHSKVQPSGRSYYEARVSLAPLLRDDVFEWRAFLAKLQGGANTFQLAAVETSQITASPLVKGGAQTGYAILTDGWGTSGLKLKAGQFATIGGQLLMLASDVTANGSFEAKMTFAQQVRSAPADNAAVTVGTPYATMRLDTPDFSYSVGPGRVYGMSFTCREAF